MRSVMSWRACYTCWSILFLFLSHFTFSFVLCSASKPHPHSSILLQKNCTTKSSFHSQSPWLVHTNSSHSHPGALACLSSLSICLASSMPACGWLDTWHWTESPKQYKRFTWAGCAATSGTSVLCTGTPNPLHTWLYLMSHSCPKVLQKETKKGSCKHLSLLSLTVQVSWDCGGNIWTQEALGRTRKNQQIW